MIRSQMISFRPESESGQEHDLQKYISMIEEVFTIIRNTSTQSFSVNVIASSIRQIVLRNDCLEKKDNLLDFFFLCQKSINEESLKKKKIGVKGWTQIIQSKVNHLKGLQILNQNLIKIQLKRGFQSLQTKQPQRFKIQLQIDVENTNIEVQQDIKLKTLYFFKWCKFVEYGKSIKKLRLKQIDDLRKSLTFNMYAVKFSYFHNWRKQAKFNAFNKQKFNQIQLDSRKNMFKTTINSFYSLFGIFSLINQEIKKIEQRLVKKVKESIKFCRKHEFFQKLSLNNKIQISKSIQESPTKNLSIQNKEQAQKLKYSFLYYLVETCQIPRMKSKTLNLNFEKSQQRYSILCAKRAFYCLRGKFIQTKQQIQKLIQFRKKITLFNMYKRLKMTKITSQKEEILSGYVRCRKLLKCLHLIKMNSDIQRHLEDSNLMLNTSFDGQLSIHSLMKENSEENNAKTSQSIKDQMKTSDLFKYLEFNRLKTTLVKTLIFIKAQSAFNRLRTSFVSKKQSLIRKDQTCLMIQRTIFRALEKNHQIKLQITNRNISLTKKYQKNLLKSIFNSMKQYKHIKISNQQALERIQQKIINPKQLLTGFNRIYEKTSKISTCCVLQQKINQITQRVVFQKCFSVYISTLQTVKRMQEQSQLRKCELLFNLLRKNQEFNETRIQQVKQNVILKSRKLLFVKYLAKNYQHSMKNTTLNLQYIQQKQSKLISLLHQRKQKILDYYNKIEKLEKYLGLSLMKRKITLNAQEVQAMQNKKQSLNKHLRLSEFDMFVRSFNSFKNSNDQFQYKLNTLLSFIVKSKFKQLINKISYQESHRKEVIQSKTHQICKDINLKSVFDKISFEAKSSYLKRWRDWRQKQSVFDKLQNNKDFNQNIMKVQRTIKLCNLSYGWSLMSSNLQAQIQIIGQKSEQLNCFLDQNRKKFITTVSQKVKSIKETNENQAHLINSIKLKYLSKFMRNSLMVKYEKVKQFCAIKSYARNLKLKSFKGLRTMLLRLRDKENRLKTQQEIITKVDKALHNSRASNKLSQTIHRFNSRRKSASKSITINGVR